jgi:hypothetical protein
MEREERSFRGDLFSLCPTTRERVFREDPKEICYGYTEGFPQEDRSYKVKEGVGNGGDWETTEGFLFSW